MASPDFDLTWITSLAPKSGKTKGCISSSFVLLKGQNSIIANFSGSDKTKRLKTNEIEQPEVLQSRFRVALRFCLHIVRFSNSDRSYLAHTYELRAEAGSQFIGVMPAKY